MRLTGCVGCLPLFRPGDLGNQDVIAAMTQNAAPATTLQLQLLPITTARNPDSIEPKPDQNPNREFRQYEKLPLELQNEIIRHLSVNEQIPYKLTSKKSNQQVCSTYTECRNDIPVKVD